MPKPKKHYRIANTKNEKSNAIAMAPLVEEKSKKQNQAPDEKIKKDFEKQKTAITEIKWLEWVMAIFTGVLAYYAYQTYGVYQNQLAVQKLDQRAWVGFEKIHSEIDETKKKISFDVIFKNTGKTVALNVVGFAGGTEDLKEIHDSDKEPSESTGLLVNPGAEFHVALIGDEGTLNEMRAGKTNYVYGTVWYFDIFKKQHWVQFCVVPAPAPDWFRDCPEANHDRIDNN